MLVPSSLCLRCPRARMGWTVCQATYSASGSDTFSQFTPVQYRYWAFSVTFVWHFKGQAEQCQGLQERSAVCPGTETGAFAFQGRLWLDLEMRGMCLLPLQSTNIKHLVCNSHCPRPDFYAGSVGKEVRTKRGGFRICLLHGSAC